jgi:sporulation protein YlmC with PRC-barrel domain
MENSNNNFEADNTTGENHEGTAANNPVRRLTATSIIGDSVESPDGEKLGKIEDLMIDLRSGCVDYVVLEYGATLGIGGKLFSIPFKEFTLDPFREIFLLARDKEHLKNAPGIDKQHWPDTNLHQSYYETVGTYWENPPIASPAPGSPLSAYY